MPKHATQIWPGPAIQEAFERLDAWPERDKCEALGVLPVRVVYIGYDALDYAKGNGIRPNKYADCIEDARDGITLEEAQAIASDDEGLRLIWIALPLNEAAEMPPLEGWWRITWPEHVIHPHLNSDATYHGPYKTHEAAEAGLAP